jgi:hypothetical protein
MQHDAAKSGALSIDLRSPRVILRALALLALLAVWSVVGMQLLATVAGGDLRWAHAAGRALLSGGDPYSAAFANQMVNNAEHSAYPYPLASLWLVLPLLPLPVLGAALAWLTASIAGLIAVAPLLGFKLTPWRAGAALLFYPTLFALLFTQWAPLQMLLLAASLWLFRRGQPLWAGYLLPLVAVTPTTGIALLLFGAVLCARERRWWLGALLGGALWYGAPLLLMPDWPLRWLATVRQYASASDQQHLLTLAYLPDGALCCLAALTVGAWQLWRRNPLGVACALLVLAMLLTPHRAHYDYPLFGLPLLLLPRRHAWAAIAAVAVSWLFPLTFELGWASSLQLSLFTVAPAIVASALVERSGASTLGEA